MRFNLREWWRLNHDHIRQVIFSAIPMCIFGVASLNLLLTNEPDLFARVGALVIGWALLNLSIRRDQYNGVAARWERARLLSHLRQLRELNELRDESLHLTFDLHATQIVQITQALGKENPFVQNTPEDIRAFCMDVQRRIEKSDVTELSKRKIEDLRDFEARYSKEMPTLEAWSKLLFRLELVLILLGTLQSGYGDLFVEWYHRA